MKTSKKHKPTKQQRQVTNCKDPVISLRGYHGTGKTETMSKYVMKVLCNDQRVLAVTLTNKAAENFSDRLRAHPNWDNSFNRRIRVGTFHSFAQSYVRQYAHLIGFTSSFSLDNDINNKILIKYTNPQDFKEEKPLTTLNATYRKYVISGKGLKSIIKQGIKITNDQKLAISILKKLRRIKKDMNVMDHDDTIYYFRKLVKDKSQVVNAILQDFSYMVVDEFQDITDAQWRIMKQLINTDIRFLGAGDPFQTLFRYAGASFERFNKLESIRGCQKFELTQNHRTTKQIVAVANGVLAQCSGVNGNTVWSKEDGPKPQVLLNPNMGFMCKAILDRIQHHTDNDGLTLNDMAVTFRYDSITNYFRKMLDKFKLPYVFYSKTTTDTPKAATVVIAILDISQQCCDEKQWNVILPYLSGIRVKKTEKLLDLLAKDKFCYQKLKDITNTKSNKDLARLYKLFLKINLLKGKPLKATNIILSFFHSLKKKIPDLEIQSKQLILIAEKSTDIQNLIENIKEKPFDQYHIPKKHQGTENFLTLGNVHQIKGQEYKLVFILGSYDHFFESHKTFESKFSITDETYAMHAAITRSRKYLYMLFPMTHNDWKEKKHPNNSSMFIRNTLNNFYDTFSIEPE